MRIAYLELDIAWGDVAANLRHVAAQAMALNDIDLLVLPEMLSTGFVATNKDEAFAVAENEDHSPTLQSLQNIARHKGFAIAGSIAVRCGNALRNRAFFILPSGEIAATYDKRHLFRMGGETEIFSPGHSPAPIIDYMGWKIKLIVCYDLRFPVFCRNTNCGYDILLVVANWPKPRQAAWHTLLAARALENLCYVCGVNRKGTDPSGIEYGAFSSEIIDYKGKVVSDPTKPVTTLSLEKLREFRLKFPAHLDADEFRLTDDY